MCVSTRAARCGDRIYPVSPRCSYRHVLFFHFSFPEGNGLSRKHFAMVFLFIFVSLLRKSLFQYSTEGHGGRSHCVVYLALVVGFPTWNVTVRNGDGGGLVEGAEVVVPSAK